MTGSPDEQQSSAGDRGQERPGHSFNGQGWAAASQRPRHDGGPQHPGDGSPPSWDTGTWETDSRDPGAWNTGSRNNGSWDNGAWNTGSWSGGPPDTVSDNVSAAASGAGSPADPHDWPEWTIPPHGDDAGPVVTTVNPRIVPAGSRTRLPDEPTARWRTAVLAGAAALALAALSGGGAYMFYGEEASGKQAGPDVSPITGWKGGLQPDAPGTASPADPSTGEGKGDGKDKGKDKPPGPEGDSGSGAPGKGDGQDKPQKGDDETRPAPPPGSGNGSGEEDENSVLIWNPGSDQCINTTNGSGTDGTPLEVRTCADRRSMKWTFMEDGTVHAFGLCMDVANGSVDDGALIQIAWCSGNPAQQFRITEDKELVNPRSGKCVTVQDGNVVSGTPLQQQECTGEDAQKWTPAKLRTVSG